MTIDDLAVATQQEFQSIREEMATKQELKEIKNEIITEITQVLGGAIERLDIHLSAYQSQTNEAITNLQELSQEHDGRLRILEKGK